MCVILTMQTCIAYQDFIISSAFVLSLYSYARNIFFLDVLGVILVDSYGDLHWFKKDMEQPPTPPNTTILFSLFLIILSLSLVSNKAQTFAMIC